MVVAFRTVWIVDGIGEVQRQVPADNRQLARGLLRGQGARRTLLAAGAGLDTMAGYHIGFVGAGVIALAGAFASFLVPARPPAEERDVPDVRLGRH